MFESPKAKLAGAYPGTLGAPSIERIPETFHSLLRREAKRLRDQAEQMDNLADHIQASPTMSESSHLHLMEMFRLALETERRSLYVR